MLTSGSLPMSSAEMDSTMESVFLDRDGILNALADADHRHGVDPWLPWWPGASSAAGDNQHRTACGYRGPVEQRATRSAVRNAGMGVGIFSFSWCTD